MSNHEEKDKIELRQTSSKDINKVQKLLNKWASYIQLWNKIVLASYVIGVSVDPLFLYILVINKHKKCLDIDEDMKYVAVGLRSVTDSFYIFQLIFRYWNASPIARELNLSVLTCVLDVLAILPVPQVIVLRFVSTLAESKSLSRTILRMLIIIQYVPRLSRVYFSAKELGRSSYSLNQVWVRGVFFFIFYIIFGHIFGAFWYIYAIFSEMTCWHTACKNLDQGCMLRSFDCKMPNPIQNVTYLNEFCPIDPPNVAVYDFGIFSGAIESGILTKTDFGKKFFHSLWWGLRNLSSFGQNLDASANVEETSFAVIISILALLLFLYLIGTLQTYMQLATTKSEERRRAMSHKISEINSYLSNHSLPDHIKKAIKLYLKRTIKEDKDFDVQHLLALLEEHMDHSQYNHETFVAWMTKLLTEKKRKENTSNRKAELWISKNGFLLDMKNNIMRFVRLRLQEGKDVDIGNILPILPYELGMSVKKQLCIPILKKVRMLKDMDEFMYEKICKFVKPAIYSEKSYIIKKNEPLDFIILVTQGIVWSFGSSSTLTKSLQKGDFYGQELLEWQIISTSYDWFPMSNTNLKCHTKVEDFTLMAVDLKRLLSNYWTKFSNTSEVMPEGLKFFAAMTLQQGFQRFISNKKAKDHNQISIVIDR